MNLILDIPSPFRRELGRGLSKQAQMMSSIAAKGRGKYLNFKILVLKSTQHFTSKTT